MIGVVPPELHSQGVLDVGMAQKDPQAVLLMQELESKAVGSVPVLPHVMIAGLSARALH
jgi:hypothetical protein